MIFKAVPGILKFISHLPKIISFVAGLFICYLYLVGYLYYFHNTSSAYGNNDGIVSHTLALNKHILRIQTFFIYYPIHLALFLSIELVTMIILPAIWKIWNDIKMDVKIQDIITNLDKNRNLDILD